MWTKNISLLKDFTFKIAGDFFKQQGVLGNQHSDGYKLFKEGYIHDVWMDNENLVLKGKSYQSQKKNEEPHLMTIKFQMDPNLKIFECRCSCEVGLSQSCPHLVGLAFYLQHFIFIGDGEIVESFASTSKSMEQCKPKGTKVIPERTKLIRKKGPIKNKLSRPTSSNSNESQQDKKKRLLALKKGLNAIGSDILLAQIINTDETMTVLEYQTKANTP